MSAAGSKLPMAVLALFVAGGLTAVCVAHRDAPAPAPVAAPRPLPAQETPEKLEKVPAPQKAASAEPLATLSAADVAAVVKKHSAKFRACQEKSLKVDPLTAGDVKVRFIVSAEGKVLSVETVETSASTMLTDCTKSVFAALRFPPGGGTFTFPVHYGNG